MTQDEKMATLANKIKASREETKRASAKSKLIKASGNIYTGTTKKGANAVFTLIEYGMTEVSQTAGTLTINGETIFTRGYMSTALCEMDKR